MVAPIFVYFASTASGGLNTGTTTALWVGLVHTQQRHNWCRGLRGARPRTPTWSCSSANPARAWLLRRPCWLGFVRTQPRPACYQKVLTDMTSTEAGAATQAARSSSPTTVRSRGARHE